MHRMQRVAAPGLSSRSVLLAIVPVFALVAPALADVTLKEQTVSTGLAGFGNGTTERTWVIAGDRSRSDEQHTYTGRFQSLAGGRQGEKDVETTRAAGARPTGKKEKVNGFDAENYLVTPTPPDRNEGGPGSRTDRTDQRLSTRVPGKAGATAFHRSDAGRRGPDAHGQAAEKPREWKGHPAHGTVELDFGAGATPEQPARSNVTRAEPNEARAQERAKKEAKEDDGAQTEATGPTASGASAAEPAVVGLEVPSDFMKVERKQP